MWQGRLGRAQREGFSASPVALNGKVCFTNDEGVTFELAAGPEFKLLHTHDLKERVLASPALGSPPECFSLRKINQLIEIFNTHVYNSHH